MKCKSCAAMALPNIERDNCGENFGQAQILAFVDLDKATDWADLYAAGASTGQPDKIKVMATWTRLMAGVSPSVVISPMLYNPAINAGGERTWGGGNATPDGKVFNLGKEPSEFTAELRKATAAQQSALEELTCMAEGNRLGMYIFDGEGFVLGTTATNGAKPIKVKKFFVSDVTLMGKEEPDYNSISIQLDEGWSKDRKSVELSDWRGADLITATLTTPQQ